MLRVWSCHLTCFNGHFLLKKVLLSLFSLISRRRVQSHAFTFEIHLTLSRLRLRCHAFESTALVFFFHHSFCDFSLLPNLKFHLLLQTKVTKNCRHHIRFLGSNATEIRWRPRLLAGFQLRGSQAAWQRVREKRGIGNMNLWCRNTCFNSDIRFGALWGCSLLPNNKYYSSSPTKAKVAVVAWPGLFHGPCSTLKLSINACRACLLFTVQILLM